MARQPYLSLALALALPTAPTPRLDRMGWDAVMARVTSTQRWISKQQLEESRYRPKFGESAASVAKLGPESLYGVD